MGKKLPRETGHPSNYYDIDLDQMQMLKELRQNRGAPFTEFEVGRVPMAYRGSRGADYMIAAVGATHRFKQMADYRCDGTDDDVEILAALNALSATGGKIFLSGGVFALSQQIARAIDNVCIQGVGPGTRLNLDGVTPVISAGGQSAWLVLDLDTDAGGVDVA